MGKRFVPQADNAFSYLEVDIKFIYIHGLRRNALLVSVIDVNSRWLLGHRLQWRISAKSVQNLFLELFNAYNLPDKFYIRNDNGSQFIARLVQNFFKNYQVNQEFCKPATPQQNAHIEAYHSILERCICQSYEFESLQEAQLTFNRFVNFYNDERIHSGINYLSPYKYLLQKGIDLTSQSLSRAFDSSLIKCNLFNAK